MMPYFVSIGWLQPNEPFRKITFQSRSHDHGRRDHRRVADSLPPAALAAGQAEVVEQ
jgi:hypothetical protein